MLADLRAMERALAEAVRRCDAGEPSGCPLIEALSTTEIVVPPGDEPRDSIRQTVIRDIIGPVD